MIFVFPMAGKSSRFRDAGYTIPKYKLPLGDGDVLDKVIHPFLPFLNGNSFRFVCSGGEEDMSYLEQKIEKWGGGSIVSLDSPTSGQAETVYRGISDISSDEPLLIFNIDTFLLNFSPIDFRSDLYMECAGVLEVFKDNGLNWSFVQVCGDKVLKTAEKEPISNLASNGLYYFRTVDVFKEAYEEYFSGGMGLVNGECYIAPMYNFLISRGDIVKIKEVSKNDILFCGIPMEYEALKTEFNKL